MLRPKLVLVAGTLAGCAALVAHAQAPTPAPTTAAAPAATAPVTAPSPAATPASPATPASVKTTEVIHALVLPMKGSYMQHEAALVQLGTQLGALRIQPAGPPFGRYFDDVTQVGEANATWEVGFPIAGDVTVAAPFVVKDVPAALSAVVVQEGPYETSAASAMPALISWVMSNGYRPVGPPMLIFAGDPTATGSGGPRVEARIPVVKTQ